ncbi:MAG: ATP-grasp domain-containing protein [Nitrospiria bacterium]
MSLLLLLPSTSYKALDFLNAAQKLNLQTVVASNGRQTLEGLVPGHLITLDFLDIAHSTEKVVAFSKRFPLSAVVSTDDEGMLLAAAISKALSLPHNPVSAIAATCDKARLRERLAAAQVSSPTFQCFSTDQLPGPSALQIAYPVVLKPTRLSGSQGVIRANNPEEFSKAFHRIKVLFKDPEVIRKYRKSPNEILVEAYIPGREVSFEGLLQSGELRRLALFDKPDPLEGPYFEETLYVSPSRLSSSAQDKIFETVMRGIQALGLEEGPIHAELRLGLEAPSIIEMAARTIGGRCSRSLEFACGYSLEEMILRNALGLPIESFLRCEEAVGVMMIPIPRRGVLTGIRGKDEAENVRGITSIEISAYRSQEMIPLPEGRSYFGFIFAKGETPDAVEKSLRKAHQTLRIDMEPSSGESG